MFTKIFSSTPQIETPSSLDQPVEDVVIKDSTLMLLGFAMVGKQHFGELYTGPENAPRAVCALGARNLAKYGTAQPPLNDEYNFFLRDVEKALDNNSGIPYFNDQLKMSIPEIAAMLAEKGL